MGELVASCNMHVTFFSQSAVVDMADLHISNSPDLNQDGCLRSHTTEISSYDESEHGYIVISQEEPVYSDSTITDAARDDLSSPIYISSWVVVPRHEVLVSHLLATWGFVRTSIALWYT
jgi:hypothetical protein